MSRILSVACALALAVPGQSVLAQTTASAAAPGLELSITIVTSDVHFFEEFDATFTVVNSGTEALNDPMLEADDGFDCGSAAFTGPFELSGNGDAVFDPGEVWEFRATCTAFHGFITATASGVASGGAVASTTVSLSFDLLDAFTVSVAPSVATVAAGDTVTWTATVTNHADYPLVGVEATARLLYDGWQGPIPYEPMVGPTVAVGNADDQLDPSEEWVYTFTAALFADRYLEVSANAAPAQSPGTRFGGLWESAVVAVVGPAVQLDIVVPTGGVFFGEIFAVDYVVTNVGDDALTNASFDASDACGPSSLEALVEFTEVSGNGDAVFDGGEIWKYHAPRCLIWAIDFASGTFSGVDELGAEHPFYLTVPVTVKPPLVADQLGQLVFETDTTPSVAVRVTNVSSVRVEPRANSDTASLWLDEPTGSRQIASAPLVQINGNGDGFVDPGETWGAEFAPMLGPETISEAALLLRVSGWNPDENIPADSGDGFGTPFQRIGSLTVVTAATTTTPPVSVLPTSLTLPATGVDVPTSAAAAVLALALGAVLILACRRRGGPTSVTPRR